MEPAPEVYDDHALRHLRHVLTDEQQATYVTASADGRAELMRVVWGSLDPTPTTEANERRLEHLRRLAYAREHFAIDEPPGWDQRGELLLRYGTPDQRREIPPDVQEGLGLVPGREVWVYYWLGQAYRLEDPRFQGNFQDAYALPTVANTTPRNIEQSRRELEEDQLIPQTLHLDLQREVAELDPEEEMEARTLETMLTRGQEAYRVEPHAYHHDHGGGRLDYVFDALCFVADEPGRTRLELNFAYWASDLGYTGSTENGYAAVLGVEAVLKTEDYRPVARRIQRSEDRKDSIDDLSGRIVVDQTSIVADPGRYRLALSVRDSVSNDVGIFTTEVEILDFPPDELAISDIQLALDVRSGRAGDPFLKGAVQVVPYPLGTFPRDRDAVLFFEIYGLAPSPTGDVLYTVEFLIRPRRKSASSWFGSSKGRVVPGVATAYDGSARTGTVREWIVLDPATFTQDLYDVEIRVIDRVAERDTARSVTVAVHD
ncbi:MAG: GWxTD domain-containing protein [bacterium]